jgi:MOSC domain-containing protein YiiM
MKLLGNVVKLYISNNKTKQKEELASIYCDQDGVIGDKFYKKDKNRSILLSSLQSYDLAKNNNIDIEYGLLGENILLDFDPKDLELGSIIKVGDIKLQIAQECTLCKHLSSIDNKLPKLLKKDRGMFVYALNSGDIKVGDKVYLDI